MVITITAGSLLCACADQKEQEPEASEPASQTDDYEKGYDLPIEDVVREEASADCKAVMGQIQSIYQDAEKGSASNVVVSGETMVQMKEVVKAKGDPVTSAEHYAVMENYQKMENFLENASQSQSGSVILYEIGSDGGVARKQFSYDGTDMYVLAARAVWDDAGEARITYVSYTRLKDWAYTEKGWFCYELCVPEPPEVTEIVDGSRMIRVRPLTESCIAASEKYVLPLGYQGNNLLYSDWDADHMEQLDYNGMFEYLYSMKYGSKLEGENYPNGIPADEFEQVIMEYLPVTAEQIRAWAVFDEAKGTYAWVRLGCGNYAPAFFDLSMPEVVAVKEHENGTITLTVDAVCSKMMRNDAVITHELTVQPQEDGSFRYLSNKILDDGLEHIPNYQYRFA